MTTILNDTCYDELRTGLRIVSLQISHFPAWPGQMTETQEAEYAALLAEQERYGSILRAAAEPAMRRVLGELSLAEAA